MRHMALALVAGALAVGAAAQTDDHGDDRASATRAALPSETSGEIDPGDDEDWFRFEVAASGGVTVETTGGLDTIGALYDANGNVLAANDDWQGLNFRIRQALDAGAYYVQVLSFGSATGSYVLRLRRVAARQADRASATRVELPSETAAAIAAGGDADWFRFEVATRGEVTVETTGDLDTVGGLYAADGAAVAFDDDSGAVTNFRIRRALDAGTYFVQVEPFDNDDIGNYALRLQSAAGGGASPAAAGAGHLRNLGDFNGDGRDDVLLRHADGRWRYYPMDGATVLAGGGAANLTRDLAWQIAGIGDFDGDGKDDVLMRKTDGRWYFYPMDGRNVLAGRGTVRMTRDLAWQVAGIGDLDGDGKDDVLMRHEDGRWHYYRMNGRRPLAGSGSGRLTRDLAWQMAGVGDFDGDGRDDVLLRRRDDGRWYFYPMNGRASIAGRGTVPLTRDLAWAVAGVGDFDADGRHDVLLRHTDGRWRYYPLQGRRVLDGAGLVDLTDDTTTTVAGIGDLNYDGCADVLARLADGGWQYYALDGRRVLSASGEAALSGDLAWGALSAGGVATGVAPTLGTTLTDRSVTLGRNETVDLAKAFVDDQTLTYEARSSDAGVVRASVDGDALTLTPVAQGTATVTVTARDPDGNTATQTFTVTVAESDGTGDTIHAALAVGTTGGLITFGEVDEVEVFIADFETSYYGKVISYESLGGESYVSNVFPSLNHRYKHLYHSSGDCRAGGPPPCEETTREAAETKAHEICQFNAENAYGLNSVEPFCRLKAHWTTGQCLVWARAKARSYWTHVARWVVVPDDAGYAEFTAGVLARRAIEDCEKQEEESGRNPTSCGLVPSTAGYLPHSGAVCDRDGNGEWEEHAFDLSDDLPIVP